MRVVLSAGHGLNGAGQPDPGAVNAELGLEEHAAARGVVARLAADLIAAGFEVVVLEPPKRLQDKIEYVNGLDAASPVDLAVEVHFNSHSNPQAHGTEVLYYSDANQPISRATSDRLAEALGTRNRGAKRRADLGWLKRTTCPAILVEVLFLSNADEAAKCHAADFEETASRGIVAGLEESMGFVDVLKKIAGVADKATEAGAALHLPVVSQIDMAKDALVVAVKGKKTKAEIVKTVAEVTATLETAKVEAIQFGQRGNLSRTRLKTAGVAALAVVLIYLGFPEEMADQVALYVVSIAGGYLGMETLRPSRPS